MTMNKKKLSNKFLKFQTGKYLDRAMQDIKTAG